MVFCEPEHKKLLINFGTKNVAFNYVIQCKVFYFHHNSFKEEMELTGKEESQGKLNGIE